MYRSSVNILNACLKDMKEFIKKLNGEILHEANIGTYSMLVIRFSEEESFYDVVAEKWKKEDELKKNLNTYL